jgi:hypothetical protein
MSANVVAIGLLCQQHLNTLTSILSESLHNIEETIPLCLVESISNQLSGQVSYSDENSRYNQRQWESARRLIADVIPGLKHHEIHHLSVTPSSFHLLCGLTLEEFGRLFESVQDALSVAYPNCPIILGPDQTSPYGSLRLKLFLCLYRLKLATTFREMEAVFGWSDTVISDWFDVVVHVLHGRLHRFHEGFLLSKGVAWQYEEISAWYRKHHDAGDYQAFLEKIRIANNKQSSVNCPHPIDEQRFTGSLWAVDGTYSVCPSVSNSQLLSRGESLVVDRMWSEYKKVHGYKIIIAISHGIRTPPKYILALTSGCARSSDSSVYNVMVPKFNTQMVPQAGGLGDAAFHASMHCISPYTANEIREVSNALAEKRLKFNKSHSSDRMVSEHGMRYLKRWGAVRGRDDARLFKTDDLVEVVFNVVWGLHNYIMEGCPVFD